MGNNIPQKTTGWIYYPCSHIRLHMLVKDAHVIDTDQSERIHSNTLVLSPFVCCQVYGICHGNGCPVFCFFVILFLAVSCELFTHIFHGCFIETGAIILLAQCQWRNSQSMGETSWTQTHNTQENASRLHNSWNVLYLTTFQSYNRPVYGRNPAWYIVIDVVKIFFFAWLS